MALFGKSKTKAAGKPRPAGTTIIAEGTRLTGELNLEGVLHIDGAVEGTVKSTGDVAVGRSGFLEGIVEAKRLLVSGEVRGQVTCDTLEIVATGKVIGEVACDAFVIEPGGQFVGESAARDQSKVEAINKGVAARLEVDTKGKGKDGSQEKADDAAPAEPQPEHEARGTKDLRAKSL